jgi:surface antigen
MVSLRAARFLACLFLLVLVLDGCGSVPGLPSGASQGSDRGGATLVSAVGCAVGGVGAAFAAKALASADAKRLKLSSAAAKKRETGYIVGLALVGCGGGAVLAGTAYAKLSEQGKKNREEALREAARSARVQRYSDPADPSLSGTVTPGPRYVDLDRNRECVDQEDVLAAGSGGTPVFAKYCRTLPDGQWGPVTA